MPIEEDWISKRWSVHIMEYYSALRRKDVLTPATTLTNLGNMILSETSQSQKHKHYYVNPLT